MIVTRAGAKSGDGHIIQSFIRSYVRGLVSCKFEPEQCLLDSPLFSHIMKFLQLKLLIVSRTQPTFTALVPPFTTVKQVKELFDKKYDCPPWRVRVLYNNKFHLIRERIIDTGRLTPDRICVLPCLIGYARTGPPNAKKRKAAERVRKLEKQGITRANVIPFSMQVDCDRVVPFSGRAVIRYLIQKRLEDKENGLVY
jgi:hypothetical protein